MRFNESRTNAWLCMILALAFGFMISMQTGAVDLRVARPASVAMKEPVAVLTEIIQADFDALDNGGKRIDNVMLSGATVHSLDGPAPGFYMLAWDAFEVATEWELMEQKVLSKRLVEFSVKFRVVGHAKGAKTNEIGISPNKYPENKVVIYRVARGKNGWKLVDPPMPIIGLEPLMNFYKAEFQELSNAIAILEEKGLAPYTNLVKARELVTRRLSDLEALGGGKRGENR